MRSSDGKSQREEKTRREKSREERRVRRKKMQMREKVGKSRNIVFFQWFVAPEGRQVGLLKRQVRSQLARWDMKKCTPLWREAHFEVKMLKTDRFGALLEVEILKKCTPLWREAHFELKSAKNWWVRNTFGCSDVVLRGRQKGLCTLSKVSKKWGFCSSSKTVGHLKRICKDVFRVAGTVQETCSSEMSGSQGADFLRGVLFWSLRSSGLLRWFCVTGAALRMTWHHFFVAGAVL